MIKPHVNESVVNGNDPLRVFSGREFLDPAQIHAAFFHPFWGIPDAERSHLDGRRFEPWASEGTRVIQLVCEEDAEVFVAPGEWREGTDNRGARELAVRARRRNRPLVIFFNSDSAAPVELDGAIVFRTSFKRSDQRPNEFAMPAWSIDFIAEYAGAEYRYRQKGRVPVVGYAGYVDWFIRDGRLAEGGRELIRTAARRLRHPLWPPHPGSSLRGRAVRRMAADSRLRSKFILRDGCRTGSASAHERLEYAHNIFDSDYALVCRGGGNFSYRLYEVLSCGRIPLLIDTDCVLPFEDEIDWKKLLIWVEESQVDSIADIVLQAHSSMTADEFRLRQVEARNVWERWLRPTGFFANVSAKLRAGTFHQRVALGLQGSL